jgi:hypothetical protein
MINVIVLNAMVHKFKNKNSFLSPVAYTIKL